MKEAQKIVLELCEFDPEFKKYEDVLLKVVNELLLSKPDTKFDPEFARTLKAKILAEPIIQRTSFFSMKRNYFITAGAALAVVVVAVALQIGQGPRTTGVTLSDGTKITKLAAGAFGSLSKSGNGQESATTGGAAPMMAFGRGGGGGGDTAVSNVAPSIAPDASGKAMLYRPTYFKYVYKGEALDLKEKNIDVLRRVKPSLDTTGAVNALKGFSFGGVDMSTFPGGQVTSYEIAQSADGYTTNVNLRDGSLSISLNYEPMQCPRGICPVQPQLRPSDMPSDEDVIAIANRFLKDHGINAGNYASPIVQDEWRKSFESNMPGVAPYIPEFVSVQYPWKIAGTTVTDQVGNPNGLNVNIDIRKKKVSGVWNITNQDYQSSAYEAETDAKRVIGIAENGGIYGNYVDESAEVVEVELGTPTRVYTTMWLNDGSGEVIVPALSFPIVKKPEGQYYFNKAIVVPLAKELLQVPEPGPIRIMKGAPTPAVDMPGVSEPGSPGIAE